MCMSSNCSEQRNKSSRWSQRRRSPSPKDQQRLLKPRISRFSDKNTNFEPKITINTSFNQVMQHNFDQQITPQNVTGQPLLKNVISPPVVVFPTPSPNTTPVIAAPPLLLNVPPPQIVQNPAILVSTTVNVTSVTDSFLTATVTLPPPPIMAPQSVTVSAMPVPPPTVELTSIPPPNPIQVQNIPQPEPINTLNIPHPAPIQVQNIPTPASIQLNEIPNPKPLDLMAIPTPSEENSKISDPPDFIKSIPPPNKSIPPPKLRDTNLNPVLPPSISISVPPPQSQLPMQSMAPCQQNILVHTIPPPQIQTIPSVNQMSAPPPALSSLTQISVSLPVGVVPSTSVSITNNNIPSLMAQPILPPPGMGVVNVSCPPPILQMNHNAAIPPPPPSFVNQPPPNTNQMPPMNVPPPSATAMTLMTAPPFHRDLSQGRFMRLNCFVKVVYFVLCFFCYKLVFFLNLKNAIYRKYDLAFPNLLHLLKCFILRFHGL